MTIPFKDKGQVIIAYRADGVVPEVDHRDQYFETVADYLKTIDEPEKCVRFIRFRSVSGAISDVTDAVAGEWLKDADILWWNEYYNGAPYLIRDKIWEKLVEEAGDEVREGERIPADDGDYAYQAWKDTQEDAA